MGICSSHKISVSVTQFQKTNMVKVMKKKSTVVPVSDGNSTPLNVVWAPSNSNGSLPDHKAPSQESTHAIDTSSVIEAHGLLTSLLLENELPPHVVDTLKRVARILDPSPTTGTPMLARMLSRGNQFGTKTDSNPSSDCEDDQEEDGKGNWRSRYNGPSKRRLKVSVWSTVTSATGLPTLVPEPSSGIIKKNSVERKQSTNSRNKKYNLDEATPDICPNDDAAYVTPWDRRLSRTVHFKRDPKSSSCSMLTDEQKQYLLRPLSDEYECTSEYLSLANSWNFPIFKFNNSTQHCLSLLSFHIFSKTGLVDRFKINPVFFRNYFETIESGYHNLPYHNAIHAADVLQACYYLCSSSIPGFNSVSDDNSDIGSDADIKSEEGDQPEFADTYGSLKDIMTDLELLALFTAAAVHDYDHPGRTNAFLVAVGDTKAVMYNDRAVLESHHVASAWYLLTSDERYNFCSGLSATEFKRFRFLLIEAVLATDLKKHFDFLAQLNAKTVDGEGMDWENAEDRILALQMCIKLADINAPCKEFELHSQWTRRIVDEFYQQGDNEAELGMPVSAYMNRHKDEPRVPELQLNFIKHLVAPLYHAMASSCLVPGSWVEISEEEDEEIRTVQSDLNCAKPTIMPHTHKFVSRLQENLDSNYAVWKEKNEIYQASLKTNGVESDVIVEEGEEAKPDSEE
ncbi:hypothetical protein ACHWQZ_G010653 [Mnemiopsis leidyi]